MYMEGNNMRKLLITAIAGLFLTGTAYADISIGSGLSLSNDITAKHKIDAEVTTADYTPEITWTRGSMDIWGNTVISMYDSSATDSITLFDWLDKSPTINMGADYDINSATEVYAKTSWDMDAGERGEIEIGMSFSF